MALHAIEGAVGGSKKFLGCIAILGEGSYAGAEGTVSYTHLTLPTICSV